MSRLAPAARRAEAEIETSRRPTGSASPAGMPRYLQARAQPEAGQLELGDADSPLEAAARRASSGASDGGANAGSSSGSALPPRKASLVRDVTRSPGAPLSRHLRREFESRLGADLGAVRLHTDSGAGRAARSLGAKAFALGQHVGFAPGHGPQSAGRQQLLSHELAHTVQHQRGAASPGLVRRAPDEERKGPPKATLSVGLGGMLFTPTEEVPFAPGDRNVQMLAIGMRNLMRDAYYPGVEREFTRHYRRRYGPLQSSACRATRPRSLPSVSCPMSPSRSCAGWTTAAPVMCPSISRTSSAT